ncbi:hypothetical protein U9M48_008316 [Paspalum notatum var. saurae]|uniref:Transposase-associated domain-containing protein n=1 Tax=Paspalum notatum var. saurae TaxID=547442 RepID=A0AAQ3SP51_PASNO
MSLKIEDPRSTFPFLDPIVPGTWLLSLGDISPGYAINFYNIIPIATFILAVLFRKEPLNIKSLVGNIKVIGTLVCVGGTLVISLYKGKVLHLWPTNIIGYTTSSATTQSNRELHLGTTIHYYKRAVGKVHRSCRAHSAGADHLTTRSCCDPYSRSGGPYHPLLLKQQHERLMARVWIYNWPRIERPYRDEVDKFIEAAKKDAITKQIKRICCPCKNCKNMKIWTDPTDIRSHLIVAGFVKDYSVWIHHGEQEGPSDADVDENNDTFFDADLDMLNSDGDDDQDNGGRTYCFVPSESIKDLGLDGDSDADDLEEMLKHFKADILYASPKGAENLKAVKDAARKNVYEKSKACPPYWTLLRFVLELLILKAKYGWSDSSFNDLLKLLSWLLPKPNFVPANTYQAKKVVSPLTMGVERIYACPNHCILYRGKYENQDKCPTYGAGHYKRNDIFQGDDEAFTNGKKRKKNGAPVPSEEDTCLGIDEKKRRIPVLVMWYLNPIDRLKQIFANPAFAKLMRWWFCERTKDDEKLSHPADATQWQRFDELYPEFAKDPRNVRFALSTDGMNPLGERNSTHSTWPVILTIYNLPSWLC